MISTSSVNGDTSLDGDGRSPPSVMGSAALLAARQRADPGGGRLGLGTAPGEAGDGLGHRRVGASGPTDPGRSVAGIGVDVDLLQPGLTLLVARVQQLVGVV